VLKKRPKWLRRPVGASFTTALNYLAPVTSDEKDILLLKYRLCQSLGHSAGAVKRPFNVVNVIPEKPKQTAVIEPPPAPGSGHHVLGPPVGLTISEPC